MSNCTCKRTTRPPFCDGSHSLTDEQYIERTQRLAELFANIPKENEKVNSDSSGLLQKNISGHI